MKAVIFDFNGTLLFDTPKQAAAWDAFARLHCGRSLPAEEYRDALAGKDNRSTVEYLLGRAVSEEERRALSLTKEQLYFDLCRADPDFALAPGVPEFLQALRAHGIPYAVATSAGAPNIDFYYETLGLARWFDRARQIVCADGKMPSKPHPAIYLRAMQQLGVQPGECTAFEDLSAGIASAVASGAGQVIAVASGQSPETLAALPGVDRVIDGFEDWPSLLAELLA